MGMKVGVIQCGSFQCGELTFDAVEPRSVGRCEVKSHGMLASPQEHLGFGMRAVVIQHEVQGFAGAVAASKPLQEPQELCPGFIGRKDTDELIAFQVIGGQEVTHAARAVIVGSQSLDPLAAAGQATSVPRLQVERAEFVDAQPPAVPRAVSIQPTNTLVFGPKGRVFRLLPGFGPPPAHAAVAQQDSQPFQADGTYDVLLDQVLAQRGQRPLIQADQAARGAKATVAISSRTSAVNLRAEAEA